MKRTGRTLVALALSILPLLGVGLPEAGAVPGQRSAADAAAVISADAAAAVRADGDATVIVSLKNSVLPDVVSPAAMDARSAEIAMRTDRVLAAVPPDKFRLLRRFEAVPAIVGSVNSAGLTALARQPDVAHVALNGEVHADLASARPFVRADAATTAFGVTGDDVHVAVLDTGIDTDHLELVDDIIHQQCFLLLGGCPTTGGSIVGCPAPGGSAMTSLFAEDGSSHGSHVAGIITKSGGITFTDPGIAYGAEIKAFKVLDDCGNGTFADVLAAYNEIIANHADVRIINMSLSDGNANTPGSCEGTIPALTTAVATTRSMSMISFAAAGNSGVKTGVGYPACITDIVSVGNVYDSNVGGVTWGSVCADLTTAADKVTCSSQSYSALDLLGPGTFVNSTVPFGSTSKSGTSMASPAAAAVAALLLDSEPGLTPDDVEQRLTETGVPVVDSINGVTACRVDAYEAVANDGGPVCATVPCGAPDNDATAAWPWIFDGVSPEGDSIGGDACDGNSDNDRCADDEESTLVPPRSGLSPWDFASMWVPSLPAAGSRDGAVTLSDVIAVLPWIGAVDDGGPNTMGRDYDDDANGNAVDDGAEYDRSPTATVGLSGAPNGAVTIQDAIVVLAQVGDTC